MFLFYHTVYNKNVSEVEEILVWKDLLHECCGQITYLRTMDEIKESIEAAYAWGYITNEMRIMLYCIFKQSEQSTDL